MVTFSVNVVGLVVVWSLEADVRAIDAAKDIRESYNDMTWFFNNIDIFFKTKIPYIL